MGNHDKHIGLDFMRRTFDYGVDGLLAEGHGEEGDLGEPLKFKLYRDTPHYLLEQTLPLVLGDARWSFQEFRQVRDSHPQLQKLNSVHLSTLLYYTYGFSRHDKGMEVSWPFHRLIPSARCYFPAELYLWLPQIEHIPAGFYHYDAIHHSLALLRLGDYRMELSKSMGANLEKSVGIILVSALFWKNAFRYRNFSYRLCTQEAGLVVGNALLVAGTLGLQGHVHYQFLDQPVNRLLGFEPREESLLAALPLYPTNLANTQQIERCAETVLEEVLLKECMPITVNYIKVGTLDQISCQSLIEIDQHSYLESTDDFVLPSAIEHLPCVATEERLLPLPAFPGCIELAQALHTRSSGDMFFAALPIPISHMIFWEIVRYALSPYINDLNLSPFLQLYIVVNHVDGLDKGIYRLCVDCGLLHVIERRDISMQLQRGYTQHGVNCASANFVCYLVADYFAASEVIGNRSYRILHMESGLIAQRLCLMSAAHGLVARCSDSYHVDTCKEMLMLANVSAIPLFQVIIGGEQPGANAGGRYRLSLLY